MTHIHKIAPFAAMAVGVALALATSAFSNAPHKTKSGDPLYTFQYEPPTTGDYSAASVQNVSNWKYQDNADRCNDNLDEACRVFVPEDYVDDPTGSPTLDASINLGVTASATNVYYVSSTDAGSSSTYISNKD